MNEHTSESTREESSATAQATEERDDETTYAWATILGLEEAYDSAESRGERHPFAKPYRRGRLYRGVGLG